eukprot:Gb_11596 [translate_table: standard]
MSLSICFRWDLSMMECLPEYMRICFKELYQTVNELECQAQKTQGREMLNYIRRVGSRHALQVPLSCRIDCTFMRGRQNFQEEDALKNIEDFYDHSFKELNWEFLKPDEANNDSLCETKKYAFNLARGLQFFYTHGDGFGISSTNVSNHVRMILLEEVPII